MVRYHRAYISQVQAVKFSLISATSIFALFSAAVGPAHAAVLSAAPGQANIYDLVQDGMTSSDGGDATVTRQDPLIVATSALEAARGHRLTSGFTGQVDLEVANTGYPTIPLGAAPGTKPDEDLASTITGSTDAAQWNAWRKAQAIGQVRVASLIGTVGTGPAPTDKFGSTVFLVAGSSGSFNDGGDARSSTAGYAYAPSGSATPPITGP